MWKPIFFNILFVFFGTFKPSKSEWKINSEHVFVGVIILNSGIEDWNILL